MAPPYTKARPEHSILDTSSTYDQIFCKSVVNSKCHKTHGHGPYE